MAKNSGWSSRYPYREIIMSQVLNPHLVGEVDGLIPITQEEAEEKEPVISVGKRVISPVNVLMVEAVAEGGRGGGRGGGGSRACHKCNQEGHFARECPEGGGGGGGGRGLVYIDVFVWIKSNMMWKNASLEVWCVRIFGIRMPTWA